MCQTSSKVGDPDLLLKVKYVTGRLVIKIPPAQIMRSISKWYSLYILGKSLINSNVIDPDLFLTYFSRSDRSLEGLLARYQLYSSFNQLQTGTVGACGECLRQAKDQCPLPFLHYTIENVCKRRGGGPRSLCSCYCIERILSII